MTIYANKLKFNYRLLVNIIIGGLAITASSQANAIYNFTDLGTLGGSNSVAKSINSSGQVVGESDIAGDNVVHAVIWNDTTATDLGTLGGSYSGAYGISNSGRVTGYSQTTENISRNATIWNGNTPTNLEAQAGVVSYGYGINNSGIVAGTTYPGNVGSTASTWNGTTTTYLNTLGGRDSKAFAINNNNQVVGYSYTEFNFHFHAALWNGTNATDLGTLGGDYSRASDINDAGLVAGWSALSSDAVNGVFVGHATLWNGVSIKDLGTLGGNQSGANAINNVGQVVGYSLINGDQTYHAMMWDGAKMVDLNSFLDATALNDGWVLNEATDLNDNGWVVGNASNSTLGISKHAFLMSIAAVPEPESYTLLLLGLGFMGFKLKSRKHKS